MFSWDVAKALKNYEKHGVSFEEAGTVFEDPRGLDWQDVEHSGSELRSNRVGASSEGRILIVVYTQRRLSNGEETTRIISARPANRQERQAYTGQ
jgi:uncharacterized DUF497 family protein